MNTTKITSNLPTTNNTSNSKLSDASTMSSQLAKKVSSISKLIINKDESSKIKTIVYDHKTKEVTKSKLSNSDLKTGTKVIGAMLVTLTLFLTGLGSLVGSFNLPTQFLPYLFVGAGSAGFCISFGLYIKYFRKIVDKVRNEFFLDGNLNDFLSVVVYTLAGLACLGLGSTGLGCIILKSNINHLTSILIFTSVILQCGESITSLIKAQKEKNYKEQSIEILNLVGLLSLFVCGIGILTNQPNGLMATIANITGGVSMIAVAALKFKDLYTKKQNIESINENNVEDIKNYLKEVIDLSDEEQKEIEEKWNNKKNKDLALWIKSHIYKNEKIDENSYWNTIYQKIQQQKDENIISAEEKKLVIQEEIKNRLNAKVEDFRARIDEDIFQETITLYKTHINGENNPGLEKDLITCFKKIKEDMKTKIKAEFFKTLILYPALTAFPILFSSHAISETTYSFSFAFSLLCNLGINFFKKFRNVQPSVEIDEYEINKEMNKEITRPNAITS